MKGKILIVDDDLPMCEMLAAQLQKTGLTVHYCTSGTDAWDLIEVEDFDVVVTDLHMPGINGIQLLERINENRPDIQVIVITSFGSLETAIAAIRVGAYDFITKPFDIDALILALERTIQHRKLREEVKVLRQAIRESGELGEIKGKSPEMRQVLRMIQKAAESDVTVLITGESGTGKELVARALHARSKRSGGPFVAINCAAMPETLLESEFFGHEKGAFTDARESRTGLFVRANGGTLFLDEIGDMPLGLQPKLLRTLEERKVRPLGGNNEIRFDARIIASTNRDLGIAIEEEKFREDLFHRINVVNIRMPSLRSRRGDILILAQHFIDQFAAQLDKPVIGLSTAAAEKLIAYSWPGNARELRNCMEHAVALTGFDKITVEDLPERVRKYRSSHVIVTGEDPSELVSMEQVEKRYIQRVLDAVKGNKALAARILGFDRKTLYRKLNRYGVASLPPAKPGD